MMSDKCKHGRLISFSAADDGEPVGLWACAFCSHKFVPLDLAMEKDAERYRWLRDKSPPTWAMDAEGLPLFKGDFDAAIDREISRGPAVGAA